MFDMKVRASSSRAVLISSGEQLRVRSHRTKGLLQIVTGGICELAEILIGFQQRRVAFRQFGVDASQLSGGFFRSPDGLYSISCS